MTDRLYSTYPNTKTEKLSWKIRRLCEIAVEMANSFLNDTQRIYNQDGTKSNKLLTVFRRSDRPATSQIVKKRLIKALNSNRNTITKLDNSLDELIDEGFTEQSSVRQSILDQQISKLRIGKWKEREDAAKAIREYAMKFQEQIDTESTQSLLNTLCDDDWVVRWTVIEALGWLKSSMAVPSLVQSLQDSNWKIRVAAIRALVEVGDHQAAEAITAIMRDGSPFVREAAIEAIGIMIYADAIPAISQAIHDSEEFVRLSAVEALAKMRHTSTTQPLLLALRDVSSHVRWATVNALYEIATPEILPWLSELLKDKEGPYWEQKRICDIVTDIINKLEAEPSHV